MFEANFFFCGSFLWVLCKSSSISGSLLSEIFSNFTVLSGCLFSLQFQSFIQRTSSQIFHITWLFYHLNVADKSKTHVTFFFLKFNCFINLAFCLMLPLENNIYSSSLPQLNHTLSFVAIHVTVHTEEKLFL